MATRQKIDRDAVERLRQQFIEAAILGRPDDPVGKKSAVAELMPSLIAARNAGMSFEQLAQMCALEGLTLSSQTLRSYFFELKSSDDVAATARSHAARVTRAGKAAAAALRAKRQADAERLAREHALKPGRGTQPKRISGQEPDAAPSPAAPSVVAAPVAVTADAVAPTSAAGTGEPSPGRASTIDELEARSQATDERTPVTEDLVVTDGKVYWASGRVFEGFLTAKYLDLLRHKGRVFAPTVGRASHMVVQMRRNL